MNWYAKHLGITRIPSAYGDAVWQQEAGPTVFAPMPAPANRETSEFFHSAPFALNFRVTDLAAMVEQLQGAGIEVIEDPQEYPNGRFASLVDPEGNAIQLWQPTSD